MAISFFLIEKGRLKKKGETSLHLRWRESSIRIQVLESAGFAVPSELGEDDVKAAVVLKKGEKMEPEELISSAMKGWHTSPYLDTLSSGIACPRPHSEK